jgi:hypothetical protein
MKTEKSKLAKSELRSSLLRYAREHGVCGKLPPERELAKALGVNVYLLRTCLEDLIQENIILRKPRKGTFFSSLMIQKNVTNIGLVIAEGQNSPFVDQGYEMAAALKVFSDNNCVVRLLNFSEPKQLAALMKQYGLDGCLFLTTGTSFLQKMIGTLPTDILKKTVFSFHEGDIHLPDEIHFNVVSKSAADSFRMRIKWWCEHNLTPFVYISIKTPLFDFIVSEFKKYGVEFDERFLISSAKEIPIKLPPLLKKYNIRSIWCNGTFGFYPMLFPLLDSMKEHHPVVYAPDSIQLMTIAQKYPDVRVALISSREFDRDWNVGCVAAEMLLRAIRTGKLQKNEFISPAKIEIR